MRLPEGASDQNQAAEVEAFLRIEPLHYVMISEEYIETEKIRRKDLHRENPNSKNRAAVTVVSSSLARALRP